MTWFDQERHPDSVPHDSFDIMAWNAMRMESEALANMVADWQRHYDYVEDYAADAFNLLWKGDPRVREPEEMEPTHLPLRASAQMLSGLSELAELKIYTVGDEFSAAVAMKHLQPVLTQALKSAQELKDRAEEAAAQAQEAQEAAEAAAGPDGSPEAQEAAQQALADAQGALDQLAQEAEQSAAHNRSAARSAIDNATEEAERTEEMVASIGGMGPDAFRRLPFAARAELARRLSNPKIVQFAAIIGAFRQLSAAEWRRRYADGADEVSGVKMGDDLTRLTTQEQINLCLPEMEEDFWRRWAGQELLVHETRSRERFGKGPMIVVVDESGSMMGAAEMWSKGFALALLDQAVKGGREFHYIGFSGTTRELNFPVGLRGDVRTAKALEMVEGFLGGGTDYTPALKRVMELVRADSRNDVVFISDGQPAYDPPNAGEWASVRERLSVRCYGIFLSNSQGRPPHALAHISDDVRTLDDVTSPHAVADILRAG